ncbi:hypothetical protein [Microbacterium jejuense]|uniref:hypothetical protein n=1 Tax=Microbacterium jejuense TaxID=1263637 RepID=UPI0031E93210
MTALPSEGFRGEAPAFPLQPIILFTEYFEDKVKVKAPDEGGTESFREREAEIWAEAWTTPQACAWSMEAWRWPVVAEYCRLKAVIEFAPGENAALVGQLHRYRDQLGLTPAGMRFNGWAIAVAEVGARRADREDRPVEAGETAAPQRRMRALP